MMAPYSTMGGWTATTAPTSGCVEPTGGASIAAPVRGGRMLQLGEDFGGGGVGDRSLGGVVEGNLLPPAGIGN